LAAAVEADLETNLATGASVAVWLDGQVIWVGGFGSADPLGTRVPDEDTLYMIGSDTKKLTAMSLLRKVAAGDIALDTTIADVLPDLTMVYAPGFTHATVHDLLSHQGGIVDGVEETSSTTDAKLKNFTYGTFAHGFYAMAPPGRIWNYSNPNFSLAGLLDETLDERPWADIVSQDLFAPLQMTRTVARKSAVDENFSAGVSADPDGGEAGVPTSLEDTWETAWVRPAGLVWSTPGDQMRLAAFLVDGNSSVLEPSMLELMTSAQAPLYPDLPGDYGYGLFVQRGIMLGTEWYDIPVISHGGNTMTHTSTFYILPYQRFAISILSNGYGDDFSTSVAAAFKSLVTLPLSTTPPEKPFDASALDALTGTYVDDYNVGEIIVARDGEALTLSAPSLDENGIPYETRMTPFSTRVWLANIQHQALDFSFIDGPDGETYFRNRAVVAIRWPEGGGWPRPMPKPSRAQLFKALAQMRLDPVPSFIRPHLQAQPSPSPATR